MNIQEIKKRVVGFFKTNSTMKIKTARLKSSSIENGYTKAQHELWSCWMKDVLIAPNHEGCRIISSDTIQRWQGNPVWAGWMEYLLTTGDLLEDGRFAVSSESAGRWEDIIYAPYEELSIEDKKFIYDQVDGMVNAFYWN